MMIIKNLTLSYSADKILLRNFSKELSAGSFIALVGRNGVGKSTLLRALAGVSRCAGGDVLYGEKSLYQMRNSELSRTIALVTTEIVQSPNLKVEDVIEMGRAPYTNWSGSLDKEDKDVVNQAIETAGISYLSGKEIDRLSDGERQRVMIARAIAQQTPVILLDEPSAFLDLPNRYQIVMLLAEIAQSEGKIIIFSTHDLQVALRFASEIWIMTPKGITAGSPEMLRATSSFNLIFEDTALKFNSITGEVEF